MHTTLFTIGACALLGPAALAPVASAHGAAARAAGADHTIVPFTSIGGIALGESPSRVVHTLGKPDDVIKPTKKVPETGDNFQSGFFISFLHNKAVDISDISKNATGPFGIGVGSPESKVRSHYAKTAFCSKAGCTITKGDRSTTWTFIHGRVLGVSVVVATKR